MVPMSDREARSGPRVHRNRLRLCMAFGIARYRRHGYDASSPDEESEGAWRAASAHGPLGRSIARFLGLPVRSAAERAMDAVCAPLSGMEAAARDVREESRAGARR